MVSCQDSSNLYNITFISITHQRKNGLLMAIYCDEDLKLGVEYDATNIQVDVDSYDFG